MTCHWAFMFSGSLEAMFGDRVGQPGSTTRIQPRQNSWQPQTAEHYPWHRQLFNLKEANQPPKSLTTSATFSSEAEYHSDNCQILVNTEFPPKPFWERMQMEGTSEVYVYVNVFIFFLFSYLYLCWLKLINLVPLISWYDSRYTDLLH